MKQNAEQFGLFPESQLVNAAAKEVWKRREVDRLLDFYLSGADLGRIAASMQRNRKAIVRKLQEYIYNERERVTNYRSRQRTSRAGKRLTQNERQIIAECRKKKVADECIAKVLSRPVSDISGEGLKVVVEKTRAKSDCPFAPSLELILAHRYIYHVYKTPVISDTTYDALKEEEEEYGAQSSALEEDPRHCPTYVKTLALYLVERRKFLRENRL